MQRPLGEPEQKLATPRRTRIGTYRLASTALVRAVTTFVVAQAIVIKHRVAGWRDYLRIPLKASRTAIDAEFGLGNFQTIGQGANVQKVNLTTNVLQPISIK
jgi:hypothetical protein